MKHSSLIPENHKFGNGFESLLICLDKDMSGPEVIEFLKEMVELGNSAGCRMAEIQDDNFGRDQGGVEITNRWRNKMRIIFKPT